MSLSDEEAFSILSNSAKIAPQQALSDEEAFSILGGKSSSMPTMAPKEKAHYDMHLRATEGNPPPKIRPEMMKLNAMRFREEHPGMSNLSDEQIAGVLQESRRHRTRLGAQTIAKAPIKALDTPQALASLLTGFNYKPEYVSDKIIPGIHRATGVDLNQEEALSPAEQTYERGLEWAGAIPGGALVGKGVGSAARMLGSSARAVPGAEKALRGAGKGVEFLYGVPGSSNELAKWTAGMGALGAGAGALEGYGGVSQDKAALLGLAPLAPAAYKIGRHAAKNAPRAINEAINPYAAGEKRGAQLYEKLLGEENVPAALSSIDEGLKNPSFLGERPTTAQMIMQPEASQLETAFRGMPKHTELKEGLNAQHMSNIEARKRAIEGIGSGKEYTQQEGGKSVRKEIEREKGLRAAERNANTSEDWDQLHEIKDRIKPNKTFEYIDSELSKLDPDEAEYEVLNKIRETLEGSKKDNIAGLEGNMEKVPHSVARLNREIKKLKGKAIVAKREGEFNLKRLYEGIHKKIDEDLISHPEAKEARKQYAKESEKLNVITDSDEFDTILKKIKADRKYKLSDSKVVNKLVNDAMTDSSHAKSLKDVLGERPGAWEKIKDNISEKLYEKADTPHAFINYFKNKKESLMDLLDENSFKVLTEIDKRFKTEKEVLKQASTVGSPTQARFSIQKEIENSPVSDTFLSKIFPALMGTAGYSLHGPMAGIASWIVGESGKAWKSVKNNSAQKAIQNIIQDPEKAKFLLEKYSLKKAKKLSDGFKDTKPTKPYGASVTIKKDKEKSK